MAACEGRQIMSQTTLQPNLIVDLPLMSQHGWLAKHEHDLTILVATTSLNTSSAHDALVALV